MAQDILFLAHVSEAGSVLPKASYEVLGAALKLREQTGARLTIGLIGANVEAAAETIAGCGAERLLAVTGPDFATPRYASDAVAAEALCRAAAADLILAPATSRFMRVLAGVAHRLNGCVDTHVTSLDVVDGELCATRWYYRQRIEGVIRRDSRPWIVLLESGCSAAWVNPTWTGATARATIEEIPVVLPESARRTVVTGIRAPKSDAQTIRPDAGLLFVAGAGWTKKQTDGKPHVDQAEALILDFLRVSGASLGGSKSLVDQSGESQAVLRFMTHLNQVGQTGSTPRHPKGLSTCCHGEEPHVVGWRFINERRAVNLDPNCGWARGKADVLYVADAFEVMAKLNALFLEKGPSDRGQSCVETAAQLA
ncbi:MAG: electron transfer flavoprotein subunit alpha/FixB family protein [Candidatus Sulfotelmatobacter sp.]